MKRKRGWLLAPLVILALLVCAIPAYASIPTMPHPFYGTVTIGGSDAAVGTVITAKVGEVEYGSYTTTVEGQYGSSDPYQDDYLLVSGEIDTGATISFYANGTEANETYAFSPGADPTELDLTVTVVAPAVAIDAVTTPTNVATQTLTGTMSVGLTVVLTADTAATFGAVSYPTSTTWSAVVTLVEGSNVITATADTSTAEATIVLDTTAPTVEITSTASDPTNTSPIPMTATFNETVTGFVVGDITVGNGTAGTFVAVSGAVYTFDVTPTADGAVTVDIAAGVAQDAATNPNEAATQFSIAYDGTAPTATVSPEADATGVLVGAAVTATFGEDVVERALGDITIPDATGVLATLDANTITIAHDDFALDTSYTVTIPAGAVDDLAGNPSAVISWSFTTTTDVIPGDATGDGVVNALDITKVERIIAGLDAETPGADANQDGVVNALDITKTERIAAGLD